MLMEKFPPLTLDILAPSLTVKILTHHLRKQELLCILFPPRGKEKFVRSLHFILIPFVSSTIIVLSLPLLFLNELHINI